MKTFHLKVIACDRVLYDGECVSLVVPVSDGRMGILAGHEPMSVALAAGHMEFETPDGTRVPAVIGIGILQIDPNETIVLADTVERPEEIDRARAQAARERAEEQLRQNRSIHEYHMAQASLARAMQRLKETSHYR